MDNEYARLQVTLHADSRFTGVRCEGKLLPVYGVRIETHVEDDQSVVVIRVPLQFVEVEHNRG